MPSMTTCRASWRRLSSAVGSWSLLGFGGWGSGRLFDLQGNYDMMWWISIALGIVSALLHWPIVEERLSRPAAVPQPA